MPESDTIPPPRRHRRRRVVALALVPVLAAAILLTSRGSRPDPRWRRPDPNGYDDFVQAGSLIRGVWPQEGDLAKTSPDEFRPFLEANRRALERARVGLSRESLVTLDDSYEGLNKLGERQGPIRNVARLLLGEAMVLDADGKPADAARSCRDVLNLGQAIAQGGMVNDAQVGWVVQSQAIGRLRKLRDRLDLDRCRSLLTDIAALDRRRVTLDALDARWATWYQGAYDLPKRTLMRWNGIEAKGRQDQQMIAGRSRAKIERTMRFFQVELAVYAFHLEKGTWPRSVAELVPSYLPSVPIDPTTNRPIAYPTNAGGELTDDLSAIARPDGEVSPKP